MGEAPARPHPAARRKLPRSAWLLAPLGLACLSLLFWRHESQDDTPEARVRTVSRGLPRSPWFVEEEWDYKPEAINRDSARAGPYRPPGLPRPRQGTVFAFQRRTGTSVRWVSWSTLLGAVGIVLLDYSFTPREVTPAAGAGGGPVGEGSA
jgi:hypothetical protein